MGNPTPEPAECADCGGYGWIYADGTGSLSGGCANECECQAGRRDHGPCPTCDGKGGTLENDMEGDGAWSMAVTRLDPCGDCLAAGLCPGCGTAAPTALDTLENFVCEACGWAYENERFDYNEEPSWGDYGD